jgi:glycerophosphoryl diester phosphodiesterase
MPELIAHRGMPRERPENTLSAFALALERGADALELDVHGTRDGVVVVHHDAVPRARATVPRLAGAPIAQLARAELDTFVVGEAERVPTLDEVLALARGRATVYVEIKARAIEALVVDVIRRSGAECAVHAFDHRIARRVHELAPEVPTGILLASYLLDPAGALRAAGARDYWSHWEFVDERLVEDVRGAGGRVVAWTVNAPEAARALVAMGVEGICTDLADTVAPAVRAAPGR